MPYPLFATDRKTYRVIGVVQVGDCERTILMRVEAHMPDAAKTTALMTYGDSARWHRAECVQVVLEEME